MYERKWLQATMSTDEFIKGYVDVSRFLGYCRQCPNYNKNWGCPPYDFESSDIWSSYKSIYILALRISVDTKIPGKTYSKKQLSSIYLQYLQIESDRLYRKLKQMEGEIPGSLLLYPGKCHLCGSMPCTRIKGLPCRHLRELRYSIEALGGDVSLLVSRLFKQELQWVNGDKLPDYLYQVGGLLCR